MNLNFDWSSAAKSDQTLICTTSSEHCMVYMMFSEPPTPVSIPDNITKPTAHTVRLICEFSGNPVPSLTWMKNGRTITNNGRIKIRDGTLLISQSEATDSGYYQCVATNSAGRSYLTFALYIKPSGQTVLLILCNHWYHCVQHSGMQVEFNHKFESDDQWNFTSFHLYLFMPLKWAKTYELWEWRYMNSSV